MLPLSQTTNFILFQTKRVSRRQFQISSKWQKALQTGRKTLWGKEKLLVTSNFSFSHSVFKRLLLQTRKNQGLFGKRLILCTFSRILINEKLSCNTCLTTKADYYRLQRVLKQVQLIRCICRQLT